MMSTAAAPAKRTAEDVTVTDEGSQVLLIHVGGELDLATADRLTERGYAAVGRRPRVLLMDLARVSFCDLRGLSSLVRIANLADRADCRYGLLAAQPQVVNLLRLTSLDQRLPVFATAGDALAQLMATHNGCPTVKAPPP
jgi:anti-sigma B factor antagonist